MEKKAAVPEILIEDIILNGDNPLKKTMHWNRLRCKECGEIVLKRAVTTKEDWRKVQAHLKAHGIEVDDGIPVRLLSGRQFRRWLRSLKKELK